MGEKCGRELGIDEFICLISVCWGISMSQSPSWHRGYQDWKKKRTKAVFSPLLTVHFQREGEYHLHARNVYPIVPSITYGTFELNSLFIHVDS